MQFKIIFTPGISFSFSGRQWVTTILAMVGKLGASAAFAVVFIYSSEIFPTILRSGGVGIGSMFARIGALAAPYIADLVSIKYLYLK